MKTLIPLSFLITSTLFLTSCDDYKSVNTFKNPSFETTRENKPTIAKNWFSSQHAGVTAYNFQVDNTVAHTGKSSFKVHQFRDQVYGMVRQHVRLPKPNNKTFVFTAMLKTKDIIAGDGWRLVVNCRAEDGYINKQYQSEPITGTKDWTKVELKGLIPEGTVKLEAGIMLQSLGTGWVDDVDLRFDPPAKKEEKNN